jgi:HEPN domain-containing protein
LKNVEVAVHGLKRAGRWLQGAEAASKDGRWDDVVYSAQMAVEQSAKAVLFALGIDFPREHDVSDVFLQLSNRDDLPTWFRGDVETISSLIAELAEQRGLAGYGFEVGIDAEYFKPYAPQVLENARATHKKCLKLVQELFNVSL